MNIYSRAIQRFKEEVVGRFAEGNEFISFCGFATYLVIDPKTNEMVPITDYLDPRFYYLVSKIFLLFYLFLL